MATASKFGATGPPPGGIADNVRYLDRASTGRSPARSPSAPDYPASHSSAVPAEGSRTLSAVRFQAAELAAQNRRQDDFLAVIFRELRSPLSAMCNAVYLLGLKNAGIDAQAQERLLIERQVGQMTRLVADLLEVSRVGNGQLRLQRERLDLRHVIQRALDVVAAKVGERRHRLLTTWPAGPVWLQADRGRLEQVIVSLLANAADYTDAGGEISLSLGREDDQAIVRVRDNGIGIAADVLPRVFDLFMQVNRSARRTQPAIGIGLSLVRSFVELHGGSVSAASAGLGQGSEFTVRLTTA